MKFSTIAAAVAFTGLAVAAPAAEAQRGVPELGADHPDPNKVQFTGVSYAGTGCPAGTVASIFTGDKTAFTLLFDSYVAESGPGLPISSKRKNCQINMGIRYPQGWQYSVATITTKGYADLPRGMSGTQRNTYYFTGAANNVGTAQTTWNGPIQKDYSVTDVIGFQSTVWSPCGAEGLLNINSAISLAGSGAGLLTTDSIDGKVAQVHALRWQRC